MARIIEKHKKRIFVADDDPAILDAITMLLEDEGYLVETTENGNTAREMRDSLPDLLLLDIWMSGVDGRDVCKYLKSKSTTNKIPIILISASKDADLSAKEAGADDFLAKPFEVEDLIQKINKYVN